MRSTSLAMAFFSCWGYGCRVHLSTLKSEPSPSLEKCQQSKPGVMPALSVQTPLRVFAMFLAALGCPAAFQPSSSVSGPFMHRLRPLASTAQASCLMVAQPPFVLPIDALASVLGSTERARMVWRVIRQGKDPLGPEGDANLGKHALSLLRDFCTASPVRVLEAPTVSSDGVHKLLLAMKDNAEVEAVLIPMATRRQDESIERTTLCISSQVGCRQGCRFCATGTMGLHRSLELSEVLGQLFEALALVRSSRLPPLTNIVFMGMGEPLDNADVVQSALELMTDHLTFNLAKHSICVSTVGPSPEHIKRMIPMPAMLAWSLHAANDELRRLLVPTTRHTLAELRDAFDHVLRQRNDKHGLLIEVTLIDGINDRMQHADELVEFIKPMFGKSKVNLIPYNPNAGLGIAGKLFQPSPPDVLEAFRKRVLEGGVVCKVRETRGDSDKASSCGQLLTSKSKRRPSQAPPLAQTSVSLGEASPVGAR